MELWDKISMMNQEEKRSFLKELGYVPQEEGVVKIYSIYEFDAVYKKGTVLFYHLEIEPGGWVIGAPISISELKKKYLDQTGERLQLSQEIHKEIKRQQMANEAETNDFRWKKVGEGNVDKVVIKYHELVGRVRIRDKRTQKPADYHDHEGGPAFVKIFKGKTRTGRSTIEVAISDPKNNTESLNLGLYVIEGWYSTKFGDDHSDGMIELQTEVYHDLITTHRSNDPWTSEICHVAIGVE